MEGTSELVRLDDRTQKRIWWPERVAEHAGEQLSPNVVLGEFDGSVTLAVPGGGARTQTRRL